MPFSRAYMPCRQILLCVYVTVGAPVMLLSTYVASSRITASYERCTFANAFSSRTAHGPPPVRTSPNASDVMFPTFITGTSESTPTLVGLPPRNHCVVNYSCSLLCSPFTSFSRQIMFLILFLSSARLCRAARNVKSLCTTPFHTTFRELLSF